MKAISLPIAVAAMIAGIALVACGDETERDDVGSDAAGDVGSPDATSDAGDVEAAPDSAVDGEEDSAEDTSPGDAMAPETDTSEPAPTFAQVRDEVIAPSCSFSVCHGSRSGAGGLALGRDPFAALVGVASTAVPERTLVVAGDVEASYLWEKLTSETPAAGELMPPGSPLDADRLELVRRWIEAGALNN